MSNLYYRLSSGKWVTECAVKTAYEIDTGKECKDHWTIKLDLSFGKYYDPNFSAWLFDHLGKTIMSVKKEEDMSLEELISSNKFVAIRVYKEKNNCTLAEAREAIDKIIDQANN